MAITIKSMLTSSDEESFELGCAILMNHFNNDFIRAYRVAGRLMYMSDYRLHMSTSEFKRRKWFDHDFIWMRDPTRNVILVNKP